MLLSRSFFALCTVFFAASCTYTTGSNDPVSRKFMWFSYVNGDDIRKNCADIGVDRYRFVYNGVYQWQTRTYDVLFSSKQIAMQVRGEANVRNVSLSDPLAPWKGVSESLQVDDKVLNTLKKVVTTDVASQPSNEGLRLYSDQFYWTVAACVDGKMHFNAYKWNTPEWDKMQFDDVLLSLDVTGVKLEEPRNLNVIDVWGSRKDARPFMIQVGKNGLIGELGG